VNSAWAGLKLWTFLISASQVAMITGLSHLCLALITFESNPLSTSELFLFYWKHFLV
jgi:hypothetical protein